MKSSISRRLPVSSVSVMALSRFSCDLTVARLGGRIKHLFDYTLTGNTRSVLDGGEHRFGPADRMEVGAMALAMVAETQIWDRRRYQPPPPAASGPRPRRLPSARVVRRRRALAGGVATIIVLVRGWGGGQ